MSSVRYPHGVAVCFVEVVTKTVFEVVFGEDLGEVFSVDIFFEVAVIVCLMVASADEILSTFFVVESRGWLACNSVGRNEKTPQKKRGRFHADAKIDYCDDNSCLNLRIRIQNTPVSRDSYRLLEDAH